MEVRLTRFEPSPIDLPPALHDRALRSPFDFLDSWSVDFEYDPAAPFTVHWHWGRTRKAHSAPTESDRCYRYAEPGPWRIAIKAADLLGQEALIVLEIEREPETCSRDLVPHRDSVS